MGNKKYKCYSFSSGSLGKKKPNSKGYTRNTIGKMKCAQGSWKQQQQQKNEIAKTSLRLLLHFWLFWLVVSSHAHVCVFACRDGGEGGGGVWKVEFLLVRHGRMFVPIEPNNHENFAAFFLILLSKKVKNHFTFLFYLGWFFLWERIAIRALALNCTDMTTHWFVCVCVCTLTHPIQLWKREERERKRALKKV